MLGKNLNWASNGWTWGYFFQKRKFENTNDNKCQRVLDFSAENFFSFCYFVKFGYKIEGTLSDRYTPWRESVTERRKQSTAVPTSIFEKNISLALEPPKVCNEYKMKKIE